MASGSSGRNNYGPNGFDFASDDILCSYEDYGDNRETSNGSHSDPAIVPSSVKEFHKGRMVGSMFPGPGYSPPEESSSHDVSSAVEKTMKKHTDNLMHFLEGLSSRLSQLELYCYNLDKSVGEMRSDLEHDHSEADLKLRSLDKHLQEVHRSVQILKDKQELAETHQELAKLQLAQKESSSTSNSQHNEERTAPPSSADTSKKADNTPDMQSMQLALALPHQLKPVEQQQTVAPPPQSVTQSLAYYVPAQLHYVQTDSCYLAPQMQDMSGIASQPAQSQANQVPELSLPQYRAQWVQQLPQQPQQQKTAPLLSSVQTQGRPHLTAVYPHFPPSQPSKPTSESLPNSMPMHLPYPGVSQPGGHADATPYVYVGPTNGIMQQQQAPHHKLSFSPGNAYIVYEGEGGRPHQPPQAQQSHFPQGGYPPTSGPLQANAGSSLLVRAPHFVRGHPHGEVIEKLVSMGYRGDHVASVIQRLEESGQPVDFNAVLDRLNGHSSGVSQGGWSG